ncbi:protein FAM214A-like isoform X1 [Scleropages formosus]|uniref:Atos homolog protein A n=1 Tax=Scleropages formosus TaxID=113540 RepID=A0A8C9SA89_SCLFO|nr:protein FAM214A-like isoform X1 [Scleropages formosus]
MKADRETAPRGTEDDRALVSVHRASSCTDASEEYFEYDAEEFLVFLTLLITEGRTPECSIKGRTEGPHCPPAQPVSSKHECNEKLPQCQQAKRTRSEVMVLWRDSVPIKIEVMLLPDCCYSEEGPGNDLEDPAIQQDAVLLERWILQPVPRQSGDRFIEEKTLLLAIRSYVFFSQLSAWLSASRGIVPRNILYRISAADKGLLWGFSQPPAEHAFPVPNVSHSVALKVHVQSLPRQPHYPVLTCSIHTSLAFQKEKPDCDSSYRKQGQLLSSPPSVCLNSTTTPGKFPPLESSPSGKATRLLHSTLSDSPGVSALLHPGVKTDDAEDSKTPEVLVSALKSISPVNPPTPGSSSRPQLPDESSSLIGTLLQERQEVIARIAQNLNYYDFTGPIIPDGVLRCNEAQSLKSLLLASYLLALQDGAAQDGACERRSWPLPCDMPCDSCSRAKLDTEPKPSPRPLACRKLLLQHPADRSGLLEEAGQDFSQQTLGSLQECQSSCAEFQHCAHRTCENKTGGVSGRQGSVHADKVPSSSSPVESLIPLGAVSPLPTDSRSSVVNSNFHKDCSSRPQNVACFKLENPPAEAVPNLLQSLSLQTATQGSQESPSIEPNSQSPGSSQGCQNNANTAKKCSQYQEVSVPEAQIKGIPQSHFSGQNENRDPSSLIQMVHDQHQRVGPDPAQNGLVTSPLKPCNIWNTQNRRSLDGTATKAFHQRTGLPLLSSPVPQRRSQTGYFELDTSLTHSRGMPWPGNRRASLKREDKVSEMDQQVLSTSAPPASLSLLGNFEECVLNYRLEPLGTVEGFRAEVGASGTFCPGHMTLPVDVSFYSVSDDNAPSPYMGVINLESLGKRGYRIPPSGTIQVTLFNPNKTVVKMFVVMYDLRKMPAGHQTFLRQRTFSVPVKQGVCERAGIKPLPFPLSQERTLRYLIHLRFQSSKSGKIYLYRDIRLLFSRKSMEVDSGAAYELKSFTQSPAPPFSPRC